MMQFAGSSLARLLQVLTLGIASLALAWLLHRWHSSPLIAITGAIAIALSYLLLMATQCLLMWIVNHTDAASRATVAEAIHAWWGEVYQVPQVFFWRQPFRWRSEPDSIGAASQGRRGIVFIHGFICNRGFWTPWLRRARACGIPFVAVNLEPVFASIDSYAPIIDRAVRSVTQATGRAPMLVCHSMGGLAARAWLRQAADASRVHRVVTIGSPHGGTWLARLSRMPNGRQMRLRSAWLRELAQDESTREMPPFTCWYSHCDNIVFPAATAMLPGADNRLVRGPAHVELAFDPRVVDGTWELLESRQPGRRSM